MTIYTIAGKWSEKQRWKALKLNLGCGQAYRTGFINLDISKKSIADIVADAACLPISRNSIESIEATQLIEHFDFIHSKYALSDWYSVLQPGGVLVLETPDIGASLKKLRSSDDEVGRNTISWLYGIDSQGLGHKTGFTFRILKSLLEEIGFSDVRKDKAKTHLYEKGLRVTCRKDPARREDDLIANIRISVRQRMKVDDSYQLIPLDAHIQEIKNCISNPDSDFSSNITEAISRAACVHPELSLILLEELMEAKMLQDDFPKRGKATLVSLRDKGFHRRLYSLWMASKKNGNSFDQAFESFTKSNAEKVRELMNAGERPDHTLPYLMEKEPEDIPFLDQTLVRLDADRLCNEGIRMFHKGDFVSAGLAFSKSIKIDPFNPIAQWNHARIGLMNGASLNEIESSYGKALSCAYNSRMRERIGKEAGLLGSGRTDAIERIPLTVEDWNRTDTTL